MQKTLSVSALIKKRAIRFLVRIIGKKDKIYQKKIRKISVRWRGCRFRIF